jgi:hypothetical protein
MDHSIRAQMVTISRVVRVAKFEWLVKKQEKSKPIPTLAPYRNSPSMTSSSQNPRSWYSSQLSMRPVAEPMTRWS